MKKIIIIYVLCLFVSCQSSGVTDNQKGQIYMNKNYITSVNANDIFTKVDYINLDVNENHLIGNTRKVLLEDGVIYLSDGGSIFQYSIDGHFISCLNRKGRGPEEYFDILDFVLFNKNIYIIDRNMKILKYGIDGKYVVSKILDFFPASLISLNDKELLLTSAYQNEVDKFHIFDAESLERKSSFCPINTAELTYRHIMNQMNFYIYNNSLLFHEPMNNSVYRIDSGIVSDYCHFDFYGKNPPEDFWNHSFVSIMDFNIKATQEKYCFGTPIYAESKNNIILSYRDAEKYLMCMYSKKKKEAMQFEFIKFFKEMPPVSIEDLSCNFVSEKNMLIAIPGHLFFDENDEPYVAELSSIIKNNGNPVIGIVRLK